MVGIALNLKGSRIRVPSLRHKLNLILTSLKGWILKNYAHNCSRPCIVASTGSWPVFEMVVGTEVCKLNGAWEM